MDYDKAVHKICCYYGDHSPRADERIRKILRECSGRKKSSVVRRLDKLEAMWNPGRLDGLEHRMDRHADLFRTLKHPDLKKAKLSDCLPGERHNWDQIGSVLKCQTCGRVKNTS